MELRHWLFLITLSLTLIGLAMVFSASGVMASAQFKSSFFFFKKGLLWFIIGLIGLGVAYKIPLDFWNFFSFFIFVGCLALVALTFTPLGVKVGGAQRWVRFAGIALQPSEFMKYALIIYFSSFLVGVREKIKSPWCFIQLLSIIGIACVPVLMQPDFGTAVIMAFTCMLVLFIAGAPIRYLIYMSVSAIPLAYYLIIKYPYRLKRVLVFLDPWKDPQGDGFQIIQSFLAIGSGNLTGVGLGNSAQKLFFLPEAHTDFIFSILAEELGFIGTITVCLLFVAFTFFVFQIVIRSKNSFYCYFGMAIASLICFQALFNVAVVTGLVPTKGISLPFISSGGSGLITALFGVGILMNIDFRSSTESPKSSNKSPLNTTPALKKRQTRNRVRTDTKNSIFCYLPFFSNTFPRKS